MILKFYDSATGNEVMTFSPDDDKPYAIARAGERITIPTRNKMKASGIVEWVQYEYIGASNIEVAIYFRIE